MDLAKLNIDKYDNIKAVNFPEEYNLKTKSFDNCKDIEVIIYYINDILDVDKFANLVKESNLSKDNRVIMVYKKGRKDGVNRDSIFAPFREGIYMNYKMRKPMLCSLSKELSGFVQSYER